MSSTWAWRLRRTTWRRGFCRDYGAPLVSPLEDEMDARRGLGGLHVGFDRHNPTGVRKVVEEVHSIHLGMAHPHALVMGEVVGSHLGYGVSVRGVERMYTGSHQKEIFSRSSEVQCKDCSVAIMNFQPVIETRMLLFYLHV